MNDSLIAVGGVALAFWWFSSGRQESDKIQVTADKAKALIQEIRKRYRDDLFTVTDICTGVINEWETRLGGGAGGLTESFLQDINFTIIPKLIRALVQMEIMVIQKFQELDRLAQAKKKVSIFVGSVNVTDPDQVRDLNELAHTMYKFCHLVANNVAQAASLLSKKDDPEDVIEAYMEEVGKAMRERDKAVRMLDKLISSPN